MIALIRFWRSPILHLALSLVLWGAKIAGVLSLLKIVETSRKPQFPRAAPIPSGGMVTILFALVSLLPRSAACIITTNVARPEPPQSIGRGCVSEICPFSTRFGQGAHTTSGPSKVAAGGLDCCG